MTKRRHEPELNMVKMATVLVAVLSMVSVAGQDLEADRRALRIFSDYHDPKGTKFNWVDTTSPCNWAGITCAENRVTEFRLPGKGLRGIIPPGSLSLLSNLEIVSLRGNKLSDLFPGAELGKCKNLKALYLAGNGFYGPLPDVAELWPQLTQLSLEFNRLNGTIPESIGKLSQLYLLNLRNNSFSGSIPVLNLANLTIFDVGNNNLSGAVPALLSRFPVDSFVGNAGLCGPPLPSLCPFSSGQSATSSNGKKRLSTVVIVGIVLGSVTFLILALVALFCIFLRNSGQESSSEPELREISHAITPDISRDKLREKGPGDNGDEHAVSGAGEQGANRLISFSLVSFDLDDLLRASAEVLGKGTVGTAYKAILEDGTVMAVKRLKDVTTCKKDFETLIQVVGKLQHRNLVPLRAYYFSKDEKLLVSDYMPMGNLAALLHNNRGKNRTPVDWLTRVRIAIGAGKGLAYLHSQGGPSFVHGNIKSSNILLNRDLEACIADFGLAQLLSSSSSGSKMVGYRAPEVSATRKVTQKSDVYSFGVLLLELLTGKAPTPASSNDEPVDLPRWVQSIVREEWTAEVFDLELMRYQNIEGELVTMLQIAMKCVDPVPERRPKMHTVVSQLEEVHPFFIEDTAEPSRQSATISEEIIRNSDDDSRSSPRTPPTPPTPGTPTPPTSRTP